MTESPKLENMGMNSSNGKSYEYEENDVQKISVFNQINGKQYGSIRSDSFVVDMERLSHQPEKDINANSRITRTFSRKASLRGGEKKTNLSAAAAAACISGDKDNTIVSTSPRAALQGLGTPEKPAVVTLGATPTDHAMTPQVHNQITINTGNATTTAENKLGAKRSSFRSSSKSWTMDPRRILIFFATISSIGTLLLIYFTLSVGKHSTDENALN